MEKENLPKQRIEDMQILDELKKSYLNYAMSVIVSRALPDVRDGLKPSQRRILVAMNDLNLGPRSTHRKCAKIAGDTSGNYHPHGEQGIYPTLVRLGQPWNMRYPLVDAQGNFGSIDGDPPAAMRYTEARMAPPAVDMLADIKNETVEFALNYDETRTEPTVLPAKFPNLLVNGSTGIAVGMATNIPPHNIAEICGALLLMINDPQCGFREIMEVLPGPDFPTGGIICGKKGIVDAYTTGRGHLTIRARTELETTKKEKNRIIVTEIPYMVVKTTIVSKIADCVKKNLIPEIADIRDESDRRGLRIVIELKKGLDHKVVLNKLFRYTPLQNTFAVANIALVENRPEILNIKQLLQSFIWHRKSVIRRRSRFLLKKCRNRAHILEGLILAVSDIDEIIEIIRKSPDTPTAKLNLMKKPLRLSETATLRELLPGEFVTEKTAADQFLTGPQTDAILNMQLQRLTGLEIKKLAKEYAGLIEQIEGYEAILANESVLMDIIREDIYEIKEKYADPRKTRITEKLQQFDTEDLIAEQQVVVTVSHAGYVKRMPLDTYRKQARGGRGIIGSDIKQDDFIEHLFTASTHDYLLIFTNRGRCYWLKVYDVPSLSRQSKGRNIINMLNLANQKIASVINVTHLENEKNDNNRQLVMATKKGIIKKTKLGAYSNPRATGVLAIKLGENDDLIGAALTSGNDHIILGTRDGMAIRFDESQVRSMGRVSRGVRGIKLHKQDQVVAMVIAQKGASLLTVCENGFGKRTNLGKYRIQKRAGTGIRNIKTTARNGKVVTLAMVRSCDEIMIITAKGIIIRTGLDQVRKIGRSTQGVRLIKLDEGDYLVAAAKIVCDISDEDRKENLHKKENKNSSEPANSQDTKEAEQ